MNKTPFTEEQRRRIEAAKEENRQIAAAALEAGKQAREILRTPVVRDYFALGYARVLAFLRACDPSDQEHIVPLIVGLQVQASLENYLFGSVTSAMEVGQKALFLERERALEALAGEGPTAPDGFPAFSPARGDITDHNIQATPDGEALDDYYEEVGGGEE